MPTARVGSQEVEKVGKLVHGHRLVCLDAPELAPVLLKRDTIASKDRIALPLGELKTCCQNLMQVES